MAVKRKVVITSIGLALAFILFSLWFVPPVYQLIEGPVTVTQWTKFRGETQATVGPRQSTWIRAQSISKHALHAIIVAEDARFYDHPGLDFYEIWASIKTNIERQSFVRGASTITQQVVKMAFLSREKSLWRKLREAIGAIVTEWLLSKEQIIEWYINLAEFGDGVYGLRQGCLHYFATKPELLTIEQAVHLALVLPSPNSWSQGLRRGSLTEFGHQRFAFILNRMFRRGYITKAQWERGLASGDFGNPIHGYENMLAVHQEHENQCASSGCREEEANVFWDETMDGLIFPPEPRPKAVQP